MSKPRFIRPLNKHYATLLAGSGPRETAVHAANAECRLEHMLRLRKEIIEIGLHKC